MAAENKKDAAKLARMKRSQKIVLESILAEIEKKYLTQEQVKLHFLHGRSAADSDGIGIVSRLDLVDAVRENARTSLQFDDCRRASRHLAMLYKLCEKFFG